MKLQGRSSAFFFGNSTICSCEAAASCQSNES
jgi:hypothetical protein